MSGIADFEDFVLESLYFFICVGAQLHDEVAVHLLEQHKPL